jgi:hypothetical protein
MTELLISYHTSSLDPTLPTEIPLAHIALGLLLGLLGWPLYSGVVRLTGALTGLALGLAAVLVVHEFEPLGQWLAFALVISATLGALIGAVVISRLEPLAWLLLGASLGVLSLWTLRVRLEHQLPTDSLPPAGQIALVVIVAVAVGVLAILLRRWLVIAATAILGAALIAPHLEAAGPPMVLWWVIGSVAFFGIQAGLDHLMRVGGQQPEVAESRE